MSLVEFNSLMTHTITLTKRKRNSNGDMQIVDTTPDLKGFVQYGNHLKVEKDGESFLSTAIVFLKDDCGIDPNYPYYLISQTAPYIRNDMEVLKIDSIDDPRTGITHHFEIIVR